jgi:hypothetical protein
VIISLFPWGVQLTTKQVRCGMHPGITDFFYLPILGQGVEKMEAFAFELKVYTCLCS